MNSRAQMWTAALRNGTYRQTSRRLRQPAAFFWQKPSFCAMGVLYDLYLKAHGASWPSRPPPGQLPQAVLEWAGVSRDLEYEIVSRNDKGVPFRDIASIVEAQFHRAQRQRRWNEAGAVVSQIIGRAQESTVDG
jgi:hypothetical protein